MSGQNPPAITAMSGHELTGLPGCTDVYRYTDVYLTRPGDAGLMLMTTLGAQTRPLQAEAQGSSRTEVLELNANILEQDSPPRNLHEIDLRERLRRHAMRAEIYGTAPLPVGAQGDRKCLLAADSTR